MKNNSSFLDRFISRTSKKATTNKNPIRPAMTPDVLPETFHLPGNRITSYHSSESFAMDNQDPHALDSAINIMPDNNTGQSRPKQSVTKNENNLSKTGLKTGKTKISNIDDSVKNMKNNMRVPSSKQNYTEIKKEAPLARKESRQVPPKNNFDSLPERHAEIKKEAPLARKESQMLPARKDVIKEEKYASASNETKYLEGRNDVGLPEKSSQNYNSASESSDFPKSDTPNVENMLSPETKIYKSPLQDSQSLKESPLGTVLPANMIEQKQDKTIFPNSGMFSHQSDSRNQQTIEAPFEPTVTINIGRIEVHAANEGRTRSVNTFNRLPPPALSLQEYLKQRSEARY